MNNFNSFVPSLRSQTSVEPATQVTWFRRKVAYSWIRFIWDIFAHWQEENNVIIFIRYWCSLIKGNFFKFIIDSLFLARLDRQLSLLTSIQITADHEVRKIQSREFDEKFSLQYETEKQVMK